VSPTAVLEPRVARLPGGPVDYLLRRNPRSRGLRVTLDPARGVLVSVPPATRRGWANPESAVERFLVEREAWLRRHLARHDRARAALASAAADGRVRYLGEWHAVRVETGAPRARTTVERVGGESGDELLVRRSPSERRGTVRILEVWFRARAAEAIDRAIERHADALGVRPGRIAILDPKSRWGSAARTGRLMFSWRLVLAPPEALDGVVVHELAHLRVFGHGPAFWALVESRLPDHADRRRWLRRHAAELHGALAA